MGRLLLAWWRRLSGRVTNSDLFRNDLLPSGLAREIHDDEQLARFLTSSSQFNATMAKPAAFMPNPSNGETSVFRHGETPRERLWQLGQENLGPTRSLHGAAIITAKAVRSAALKVEAQEPPPRHANIVGWPVSADDPALTKAKQKEAALGLASVAVLLRRQRTG